MERATLADKDSITSLQLDVLDEGGSVERGGFNEGQGASRERVSKSNNENQRGKQVGKKVQHNIIYCKKTLL
jgi:hypothetical protein